MDIRINLLPPEIKYQLEQRKKQQKIMMLAAVIFVLFICLAVGLQIAKEKVNRDIAKLQQQKMLLEQQVATLKPYAELQAKKEQVDNRVKKAMGTSPDYPSLLEGIGLYLPPNIWLEDFSTNLSKNSGKNETKDNEMLNKVNQVTEAVAGKVPENVNQAASKEKQVVSYGEVMLRGYALNNFAVANWLKELAKFPQLTDIRLQSTAERENAGDIFTTFEIRASLAEPKDKKSAGQRAGE
ncbi:PilN domain-containing protein [Desulfotomaculum sp. 1211_IL3151]|uniref:PilN domain-containing protein n=1 Tax=Desulfotomaculum sp. 1211_IL3151 TaxID=3084055 RepID=UPI002FDB94FA